MLNVFWGFFFAVAFSHTFIYFAETAGRPPKMICTCPWKVTETSIRFHVKSWLMFFAGATSLVTAFNFTLMIILINAAWYAVALPIGLHMLMAWTWFHEWWRHSKDQRKKLKDKALGRVKETVAGLKVVPEPGHARESL